MEREKVNSSNIQSIEYDEENQILEVEFKGGAVYQYSGVSVELSRNLLRAKSHGSFFAEHIKNSFRTKKL